MSGKELPNIQNAHLRNMLAGDGFFSKKCHEWLQNQTNCIKALLTHSCTVALEMSALLLDIQPGDEIIMPSYTFVSTANAFVLLGGLHRSLWMYALTHLISTSQKSKKQ